MPKKIKRALWAIFVIAVLWVIYGVVFTIAWLLGHAPESPNWIKLTWMAAYMTAFHIVATRSSLFKNALPKQAYPLPVKQETVSEQPKPVEEKK